MAIYEAQGKVDVKNMVIEACHANFSGISLQRMNEVSIKNLFMRGGNEVVERNSIGTGLCLINNESLYLRNCSLVNLKFGFEIQDWIGRTHSSDSRSAKFIDISTEKCSIGAKMSSDNPDFKVSVQSF